MTKNSFFSSSSGVLVRSVLVLFNVCVCFFSNLLIYMLVCVSLLPMFFSGILSTSCLKHF
jgi:hypothetical protein